MNLDDLNKQVGHEMTFLSDRDFRGVYQRSRISALSKDPTEHVAITLLRIYKKTRAVPRFNLDIFQKDFVQIIEKSILEYVIETDHEAIQQWACLPYGTILMFYPYGFGEPVDVYDSKGKLHSTKSFFVPTNKPTNAFALRATTVGGVYNFGLISCYFKVNGGPIEQERIPSLTHHYLSDDWDLEHEINEYKAFVDRFEGLCNSLKSQEENV